MRSQSPIGPAAQKKPWLLYSKNTALVNLDHNYNTHIHINDKHISPPRDSLASSEGDICPSLAVAGVAGAVVSALASVLGSNSHLRCLQVRLLGSNSHDEGLSGGSLHVAQIRSHPTPVAATAAAAAGPATTFTTAARRHFWYWRWKISQRKV